MDYADQLMSKNGMAVTSIAREFLKCQVGQKTCTVTELSEKLNISRGTAQSAIRTLEANDAVRIARHGHMGSILTKKNEGVLLGLAGIHVLIGAMPLPYSRKYEGLATGLISAMDNRIGIPITLSYMRGAKNRIAMVVDKRYDFAIVSKYAAAEFLSEYKNSIDIVQEFGEGTYCSSHAVIFHDSRAANIRDGMKVGIDMDSIDQSEMTKRACEGKKVQYCPVEYNTLLERVISGDLDATVWNEDEIKDKMTKINYRKIGIGDGSDTNAVIITDHQQPEIGILLHQTLDVETVLRLQKLVEEGKITPSY
jgi:predicted transcriptional regulator